MPPRINRRRLTPREQALAWWKERTDAHRYVVTTSEVPSPAVARVLRRERLVLDVANKRTLILTTPDRIDERGIFIHNYWPVTATVLVRYAPAAVAGIDAVRLHLGEAAPPQTLLVSHRANHSEYALTLFDDFSLRLRPTLAMEASIVPLSAPGTDISVLSAADLLVTLDLQEIERNVSAVCAWVRHLTIRTSDLQTAAHTWRRPNVLSRLGVLASELGNTPLAEQVDTVVRGLTPHPVTTASTGIGTRIVVPPPLVAVSPGRGTPWRDRQVMSLTQFRDTLDPMFNKWVGLPPEITPRTLFAHARQAKTYDAYHNTTLEGYRISRTQSDAVIGGGPLPEAANETELHAIMAVQGYSHAFDRVLALAQETPPPSVDAQLIFDLYGALFRPSVDVGYVAPEDLRRWRTSAVGLAGGWRHVPPNAKKIPDLIEGLTEFLEREPMGPVTKAVLTHLEFVTIHPFLDGNGRIARLLMNYLLLRAGYPWVTIRSNERVPYFKALERAQVDEDVTDIGRFLAHHIAQATTEVRARTPGKRGRR